MVGFDGLSFLASGKTQKRIAAIAALFLLVGVAYALLTPKWYRSTVTLVPAKSRKAGGLGSALGAEAGGVAAAFLDAQLSGSADVARIAAVLQSVTITDAVIQRFDLDHRYREKYRENTREALWRHCEVKPLPKPELVQLTCEDKDPRFVQDMLAFFADEGNRVFRRISVSSASEEARFLETRVAELRSQADDASARMREFQEKHHIIDLDTQAKAVVSALSTLHNQRISKQLELDYARTFSSRDEATTRQLESQLSVVGEKLRDLQDPAGQVARSRAANDGGMFPAALQVPKLRAEFETLFRDRTVAETTLVFALERLEGAKASEARDVSTFQVLDAPTVPTRPYRPKRSVIALLSLVAGLVAGTLLEWVRSEGGLRAASNRVLGPGPQRDPERPATRIGTAG